MVHTAQFFTNQKANNVDVNYANWRRPTEYLSMHFIYLIQSSDFSSQNLCILTSPENVLNYNYIHYSEQYQYFLPNKSIHFKAINNISDTTAQVYVGNCDDSNLHSFPSRTYIYNCLPGDLKCPINYHGDFIINY